MSQQSAFAKMMSTQFMQFMIAWGPTIIFVIGITLALVIGFFKGLRRSLLTLIHSVAAAAICLVLFFTLVNNTGFDKFLLSVANSFNKGTSVQELMGVSQECTTFREIIHEYLPKQLDYMNGIALIIEDNGAYLDSLVDMCYRVIFGLVFYILYLLLLIIEWIITICVSPEWKYRNKRNADYQEGRADTPYRVHPVAGLFVEAGRNFIEGIVFLSFIGTFFFIIGGGVGEKKEASYTFDTKQENMYYGIYQSFGEYGTQGVYKVLNLCKDSNDTPYYLYVADLVFQGGLKDSSKDIDETIYFRDELAAYVSFSRDTFDLVMKYNSEDMMAIMDGSYDGEVWDAVVKVLSDEDFQAEFREVIDSFDSKTYFINLTLSLLDSAVNYLNNLGLDSYIPAEAMEVINIAFKEGYLSDTIPYEAKLKASGSDTVLGYIKPSMLLTKEDVTTAYDILIDYITVINRAEENDTKLVIDMIDEMMPDIKKLSILSTDRADELNPVLKRLYAYADAEYLSGDNFKISLTSKSSDELTSFSEDIYEDSYYDSINWIEELYSLVDCVDDGLDVYENIYNPDSEVIDMLFNIFNPEKSYYEENKAKVNNILNCLSNSKILSEALGSSAVSDLIKESVSSFVSDLYVPDGITYSNTYDEDGRLVSQGEVYNLVAACRTILSDMGNKALIENLQDMDSLDSDSVMETFTSLLDALNRQDSYTHTSAITYILKSKLLLSVLSGFIMENAELSEDFTIYIDDSVKEHDSNGNAVNMITSAEAKEFFNHAYQLMDLAEEATSEDFKAEDLLTDESLEGMLDSKIIEGTISLAMVSMLSSNEIIIIPSSMENHTSLVTKDGADSEIRKILSLREDGVDISVLISDYDSDDEMTEAVLSFLRGLSDSQTELLLDSDILYYSLSNFIISNADTLISDFEIVVPSGTKTSLKGEHISEAIIRSNLVSLISDITLVLPENLDDFDVSMMMNTIVSHEKLLDDDIISATVISALVNNESIKEALDGMLVVPEYYEAAGERSVLAEYTKSNIWYIELYHFIKAMDCLFHVSEGESFTLDDTLMDSVLADVKSFNDAYSGERTKLDVITDSEVLTATLSSYLDDIFSDMVSESALDASKNGGIYTKESLKALVDACNIFSLDLSSGIDSDEIVSQVKDRFLELNTANTLGRDGESDLSLVYKSAIIREMFSNAITDMDILSESKTGCLKDKNGAYLENEISSLIDFLNITGVTSLDDPELISETVEDNILNLLDANEDGVENLAALYDGYNNKICGCLLASTLEDAEDITVPSDAYAMNSETLVRMGYITYEEADALLKIMDNLKISARDFDLSSLNLDSMDTELCASSSILSASLYDVMTEDDTLLVPISSLNEDYSSKNTYIRKDELLMMLDIIKENKDDLFETDADGNTDITDIKITSDTLTVPLLRKLIESRIFEATLVSIMASADDSVIKMPKSYQTAAKKDSLCRTKNNIWFTDSELSKLADAVECLGYDSFKNVDADEVMDFIMDDKMSASSVQYPEKTNADVLFASKIFAATLSSCIDDELSSDVIDSAIMHNSLIYDSSMISYTQEEITNLSIALFELKSSLPEGEELNLSSDISIQNFRDCDRKKLYVSYLIKGILTKKISDEISDSTTGLKDSSLAYENEIKVYKNSEIESLISMIPKDKELSDLDFETDFTFEKIQAALIVNEDGTSDTNILVQSISSYLVDNDQITIPKTEYDSANKRIYPASVLALINGILAFDRDTDGLVLYMNDLKIPQDETKVNVILQSKILKASMTSSLSINDSANAITGLYLETGKDLYTKEMSIDSVWITIISDSELTAMLHGMNLLSDGGTIGNATLDFETLTAINDAGKMDELLQSDMIYIAVCEYLQHTLEDDEFAVFRDSVSYVTSKVMKIDTRVESTKKLLTKESVSEVVTIISE